MLYDSPYWTQLRRELVEWLNDRAPSFVPGYVGALRLLHTPDFPGRVHFVCHVVRDIYRKLPTAFGAKALSRWGEVFPGLVKDIVEQWEKSPPTLMLEPESMSSDVLVSAQVHRRIVKLVEKFRAMADQPSVGKQLAIALYGSVGRREDEFIDPWIINRFDTQYDFFVSKAHLARTMDDMPTDEGLVPRFEAFERAFHSLVGPYFTGKEELDAILQDTNEAAD